MAGAVSLTRKIDFPETLYMVALWFPKGDEYEVGFPIYSTFTYEEAVESALLRLRPTRERHKNYNHNPKIIELRYFKDIPLTRGMFTAPYDQKHFPSDSDTLNENTIKLPSQYNILVVVDEVYSEEFFRIMMAFPENTSDFMIQEWLRAGYVPLIPDIKNAALYEIVDVSTYDLKTNQTIEKGIVN